MERTARMCPEHWRPGWASRMDGSLTIIHLKMYASMVVEQAVEPPMGKTENPAATVRRRLAEQGRPLMYPKRRTKLELEEMAGTAVAVAVGPEDCLHLRRLMARQNYRPVSGSRRTADRRGKGLPGSNGGPGGVILYFGVRKKLVSGPIRDKSGRALLDRLGRRLIV